ncbi:MAG: hypothetical protein LBH11_04815 [Propionibacteriaceae bacterium]|jgi:DNA-binding transcriptional regulator LsrR (DeoR family)|nr:hypothetical protein [Propionibacteriaceae bacterium]
MGKGNGERLRRLERVARLYYEQDMNQADIAKTIGVSRPFVSRLLAEAKEAGIVEVRIHSTLQGVNPALEAMREAYGLTDGLLIPEYPDDTALNSASARAALEVIERVGGGRLGLGWGHVIGQMVSILDQFPPQHTLITDVTPLVGNRGVPIRHYHSNENARILAQQTMSLPHFLHIPALAETRHELELLTQTKMYQDVLAEWGRLDVALVNVGNHPSTPDFATQARFGNLLTQMHVVGRLVAYYFNAAGKFAWSDHDYVIQIPMELLRRCPVVIGLCSANVSPAALIGALNTGVLTHLVARESTVIAAMERREALREAAISPVGLPV